MATLKPRPDPAQTLAALAWAAAALTPVGWFYGFLAFAYSHLGDVTDAGMMTGGVALFAAAPTSAFILAVYAARAGHRSGKIAVIMSGLLLLALFVFSARQSGGWINVAVIAVMAVVAVLVSPGCAPAASRRPGRGSALPGRSDGSAAGHHPQPDWPRRAP
jgi:hypothetical protein